MNKILITGATGLIGTYLVEALLKERNKITVLSRNPKEKDSIFPTEVKMLAWDYKKPENWTEEVNDNDVIIHLAGANIFGRRWSSEYKELIIESRENSTKNIVEALRKNSRVKIFISASGIGYYGDTGNHSVDETGSPGNDFLAEVCKVWESPAYKTDALGIRRINMRMGLVLSTKDGYLSKLLPPYRMFIGGPLGTRENWLSWIHINDLVDSYLHVIKTENIVGPVNICSPNQVRSGEFAKTLGRVMHRPSLFTVPEFALRIIVGEGAKYITYSQKVTPSVLQRSGFQFRYPELKTALKDLVSNRR